MAKHFSSPSDLMKSNCWLDESLSSTTNVLFQRFYQLPNDTTECKIYTKRAIVPIINRIPISIDNDDDHHEVLVKRQTKNYNKYETARNFSILPIGSTIAVQREDIDGWIQGTIIGMGYHNHHDHSYII